MRSLHEAVGASEVYSPAEELFNRRRRTVGFVAGPLLLIVLLLAPLPLARPAHTLAAILAMMVVLWVTEALPLAVTALIGPVLAVILQVGPARTVLAPFADPIIFLFIGSFMLAEAMFATASIGGSRSARCRRARSAAARRASCSSSAPSPPASRCGSATPRRRR